MLARIHVALAFIAFTGCSTMTPRDTRLTWKTVEQGLAEIDQENNPLRSYITREAVLLKGFDGDPAQRKTLEEQRIAFRSEAFALFTSPGASPPLWHVTNMTAGVIGSSYQSGDFRLSAQPGQQLILIAVTLRNVAEHQLSRTDVDRFGTSKRKLIESFGPMAYAERKGRWLDETHAFVNVDDVLRPCAYITPDSDFPGNMSVSTRFKTSGGELVTFLPNLVSPGEDAYAQFVFSVPVGASSCRFLLLGGSPATVDLTDLPPASSIKRDRSPAAHVDPSLTTSSTPPRMAPPDENKPSALSDLVPTIYTKAHAMAVEEADWLNAGSFVTRAGGQIHVWTTAHDRPRFSIAGASYSLNRDSSSMAVWMSRGNTVRFYSLPKGELLSEVVRNGGTVAEACLLGDGRRSAVGHHDGRLAIVDVGNGTILDQTDMGAEPYRMEAHPTKPWLYIQSSNTVACFETEPALKRLWIASIKQGRCGDMMLNPDGESLAISITDFTSAPKYFGVRLYRAATGDEIASMIMSNSIYSMSYSPAGDFVAAMPAKVNRTFTVYPMATPEAPIVINGFKGADAIAFAPDGSMLVAGFAQSGDGDRYIKRWSTGDWSEKPALFIRGGGIEVLEFSPDGKYLLAGHWNGSLSLWDIARAGQ